jgi:o-succinylbenzoate---CoA ligase
VVGQLRTDRRDCAIHGNLGPQRRWPTMLGRLVGGVQPRHELSSPIVEEGAPLPPTRSTAPHHALALVDAAEPSAQAERVTEWLVRHGPSLAQSLPMVSLVAVTAAGSPAELEPLRLRMVQPSEVAGSLAASLSGGPPIAPLPADPIEQGRAITMFQPGQPVTEADAAVVVATSGSTGAPKAVVLSRAAIHASVEAMRIRLGGAGDWALALPTHYIAGLMVLARSCLDGTRAVSVRSDLSNLPQAAGILSQRRYISLVPAQLDKALRRADATEALASFSAVLVGGAPASLGLVERARDAGIRVVITYGMSETCGGCVVDGDPLPGVAIELADDGRILIGSSTLFTGYRLRPDLTAEAVVGGKLRTQDRGCWRADNLVVLGRMDDIVITGGHKVDLSDVERSVQRWAAEGGADAAVLGVPDPVWGTTVIAVSDSPGSLKDLQSVVREWLPAYAVPRELIYLDQLPRLISGKPDRMAIRSMIINRRAARQATG